MNKFVLVSDSVIDVTAEFFSENDVKCVPLSFTLDGRTVVDDLGATIPYEDFYKALREGKSCTTSQGNVEDFKEVFIEALEQGMDIVYVGFSSGLSGSYNSGVMAANELRDRYSNEIYCIDTLSAAGGHGILVRKALEMRNEGKSAKETAEWVENNKQNICHWITVDDLNHLQRGGRVSKTAAIMGTLIGIKPIIFVNEEGKLIPCHKVRGRKQSIEYIGNKLIDTILEPEKQTVYISHGDCIDDANYLKEYLLENCKGLENIEINMINNVIGAHTGPGVVVVFFVGKNRI